MDVPESKLTRRRAYVVHQSGDFLSRQRGVSLLEVSMVLGFVIILFTLAVSMLENWKEFELKVVVVEAMREEAERDVPIVAEAVRQWYLHEYCGQGAVDHHKPQLPESHFLACEALPLPPMPRRNLDSFTNAEDEPDWRNIAPYLPDDKSGFLDRQDHGYTWEVYRLARDPNDTTELTVCEDVGLPELGNCRTETVPRGPPALIEVSWSPPADISIEDLEKLAEATGGTYSMARTVRAREIQNLVDQSIGRTRTPAGFLPELDASAVDCMRHARSRARVRFGPVAAVAPPEQRDMLKRAWSAFWTYSDIDYPDRPAGRNYNANTDNVVDERDYLLWGC